MAGDNAANETKFLSADFVHVAVGSVHLRKLVGLTGAC